MTDIGITKTIQVSKLKPSKFNTRDEYEPDTDKEFQELVTSIRTDGMIEPIIVRKSENGNDDYEAIAGTRRLRALKELGIKETSVLVRKLSDNDVRIMSLVENIHRKGLDKVDKKKTIQEIYGEGGYPDLEQVKGYLGSLRNRRYKNREDEKIGLKYSISKSKSKTKKDGPAPMSIPNGFVDLCERIGYAPSTQYSILASHGSYEDEEKWKDVDHVARLKPSHRVLVKEDPVLKKHPEIQQEVASIIRRKGIPKADHIVKQYSHDIKTGAREYNKSTGEYNINQSKYEPIKTKPNLEITPTRAREELTEKLAPKMFKILTGMDLNHNDVTASEKMAVSSKAQEHMKAVCSHYVMPRELPALEYAIAPLQKALDKFMDILYEAGEAERRKNELQKR